MLTLFNPDDDPMTYRHQLTRALLYLLVGSVILAALLGIIIVLRNTWGWFEIRVILTTITVALGSLCGLACDVSRTPRGMNLLPWGGLVLTGVSVGMILLGMWINVESDAYWKATFVISIFTVAMVHVCLLSIARLAGRFRWVFMVACQVIFGLAAVLSAMILWEIFDENLIRLIATLSIIDAALTLVIPLLHRISRGLDHDGEVMTAMDERSVAAIDVELAQLKHRIAELEKLKAEICGNEPEGSKEPHEFRPARS